MSEQETSFQFTKFASRLNSFRGTPARSPLDALRLLSRVPGITATELNYPQHFSGPDDQTLVTAAQSMGLAVTALNLRFDPPQFAAGSFTNPDPVKRAGAIELARQAVDIAGARDIGHVILWLGPDGFDYPLQANYQQLWQWAVDGVRSVAAHRDDVIVSIEPKPADPRRFSLVRGVSDALLLARDAGLPNIGVTLDFCHALMSGESPAMAASLALHENRLVGVHLNDGYGALDDGLMVGSVHPVQAFELLWVLKQSGWNRTIYFDTFPEHVDPVAECAANIAMVNHMVERLETIDSDQMARIQAGQDSIGAVEIVRELLLR
jgi:xylose isomerase